METSVLNIGDQFLRLWKRLRKEIDFTLIDNLASVLDFLCLYGKMNLNNAEKENIFNIFWNSGLHGARWGRVVYSIVVFRLCDNSTRVITVKNCNKKHSEHNAVEFLRELLALKSLPSQTMKWYVNFSPCRNCSDTIDEFIMEARELHGISLKIDMQFSSLYRIRRPSCVQKQCPHIHEIPTPAHQGNVEGLCKLRSKGVTLSTLEEGDWTDLCQVLGVAARSTRSTARFKEDLLLKDDFQHVLSEDCMTGDLLTPKHVLQLLRWISKTKENTLHTLLAESQIWTSEVI